MQYHPGLAAKTRRQTLSLSRSLAILWFSSFRGPTLFLHEPGEQFGGSCRRIRVPRLALPARASNPNPFDLVGRFTFTTFQTE